MVQRDIADRWRSRLADFVSTIDRYDCLLGAIPLAFLIALFVGTLFDLSFETAVLGGVAIALPALLDGLFFRPPGLQSA